MASIKRTVGLHSSYTPEEIMLAKYPKKQLLYIIISIIMYAISFLLVLLVKNCSKEKRK